MAEASSRFPEMTVASLTNGSTGVIPIAVTNLGVTRDHWFWKWS